MKSLLSLLLVGSVVVTLASETQNLTYRGKNLSASIAQKLYATYGKNMYVGPNSKIIYFSDIDPQTGKGSGAPDLEQDAVDGSSGWLRYIPLGQYNGGTHAQGKYVREWQASVPISSRKMSTLDFYNGGSKQTEVVNRREEKLAQCYIFGLADEKKVNGQEFSVLVVRNGQFNGRSGLFARFDVLHPASYEAFCKFMNEGGLLYTGKKVQKKIDCQACNSTGKVKNKDYNPKKLGSDPENYCDKCKSGKITKIEYAKIELK